MAIVMHDLIKDPAPSIKITCYLNQLYIEFKEDECRSNTIFNMLDVTIKEYPADALDLSDENILRVKTYQLNLKDIRNYKTGYMEPAHHIKHHITNNIYKIESRTVAFFSGSEVMADYYSRSNNYIIDNKIPIVDYYLLQHYMKGHVRDKFQKDGYVRLFYLVDYSPKFEIGDVVYKRTQTDNSEAIRFLMVTDKIQENNNFKYKFKPIDKNTLFFINNLLHRPEFQQTIIDYNNGKIPDTYSSIRYQLITNEIGTGEASFIIEGDIKALYQSLDSTEDTQG